MKYWAIFGLVFIGLIVLIDFIACAIYWIYKHVHITIL